MNLFESGVEIFLLTLSKNHQPRSLFLTPFFQDPPTSRRPGAPNEAVNPLPFFLFGLIGSFHIHKVCPTSPFLASKIATKLYPQEIHSSPFRLNLTCLRIEIEYE
jgi:hypothetical protein